MPVAKWGKAFLERGLMDGRFLKPVYDGETAIVTAADTDTGIAIKVESRGELCAMGHASMPSDKHAISLSDFQDVSVVAKREPVNTSSYAARKVAWDSALHIRGATFAGLLCVTFGKPIRSMRMTRLFTPGCSCAP